MTNEQLEKVKFICETNSLNLARFIHVTSMLKAVLDENKETALLEVLCDAITNMAAAKVCFDSILLNEVK